MTWYCVKYQRPLSPEDIEIHHCFKKRRKLRGGLGGFTRGTRCPKCIRL